MLTYGTLTLASVILVARRGNDRLTQAVVTTLWFVFTASWLLFAGLLSPVTPGAL